MIQLGEVVMILEWHRQGMSVSAIARQSGLDRKAVRKYIQRSSCEICGKLGLRSPKAASSRS